VKKDIDNCYLDINEYTNALDYLSKTKEFLHKFDDPLRWKWCTIALTNALYGFMICALNPGDYARVIDFSRMPKKDKKEYKQLLSTNGTKDYFKSLKIKDKFLHSKNAILISFKEALHRIILGKHKFYTISRDVNLTDSEKNNVEELRSIFRNTFEHYKPLLWSIEKLYFIPLFNDTINTIEKVINCGNFIQTRVNLEECNSLVNEIKLLIEENAKKLRI